MSTPTDFEIQTMPPNMDRTKSEMAARLLTLADQDATNGGDRRVIAIDFDGDRDAAHQRTRSWRKTLGTLGYVLHHRADKPSKKLLLWCTKSA